MIAGLAVTQGCAVDRSSDADIERLLAIHEAVLEAHRTGDIDAWMALEGEEYVSVNGGAVTFLTVADREAVRGPYLASATFELY